MESNYRVYERHPRIKLREKVNEDKVRYWLNSLEKIVNKYKWAQTIKSTTVFGEIGVNYVYYKSFQDIPYEIVLSFYSLCLKAKNNLVESDFDGLVVLVCDKFNDYYEPETLKTDEGSDLPF